MDCFAKNMILCHTNLTMSTNHYHRHTTAIRSLHRHDHKKGSGEEKPQPQSQSQSRRSGVVLLSAALVLGASAMLEARRPLKAAADQLSWGTRSFIKEKYFQPQLSPEDAVARIRQTTEGLRDMRRMLDTMSWRYVMFYIRLKSAYLDSDLKNAMSTLPENQRKSYIKTANEVVENMSELDRYVRSPKVYESYLYYEKTLKSLDQLVAMLG